MEIPQKAKEHARNDDLDVVLDSGFKTCGLRVFTNLGSFFCIEAATTKSLSQPMPELRVLVGFVKQYNMHISSSNTEYN